jgi:AraC-like DNA-binding protein
MHEHALQAQMITLLEQIAPREGIIENIIDGINVFRITKAAPREPQTYDSGIIILAQGKKRIFVGETEYVYDPMNYLVMSVPLPLECETMASVDEPVLGLKIKVAPATVGEILLGLSPTEYQADSVPKGLAAAPLTSDILDAVVRLLQAIVSPEDRDFLAPLYEKEIIYRVLQKPEGESLRAMAFRQQRFFQIARTLEKIHHNYEQKFDVNFLAEETGMSISSFHSNFKKVTNVSPLQYIKTVKLHKARLLMIQDGLNVSEAAYKIGYESPAQFNREYKRLFGAPPKKDSRSNELHLAWYGGKN